MQKILHLYVISIFVLLRFLINVSCENSPSVIIVGAGPSGIAAATKLFENGITNLTILEAENRIGGRIYSTKFADTTVDLGAEFCHGIKNNIVFKMANNYSLLQPLDAKLSFFYSSQENVDATFFNELFHLFSDIHDEGEKLVNDSISVGEYLTNRCSEVITKNYANDKQKLKQATEFLDFFLIFLTMYDSPFSIFDLSLPNYYRRCEGNQFIKWKQGGYNSILDILMRKYPDPKNKLPIEENILLNTEVKKIVWEKTSDNSRKVLAESSDGSVFTADYLIFTPSLGVLKNIHENMFNPHLSEEKVNAINKLGMGAVSKICIQFPERWWPTTDVVTFNFVWSQEDKELLLKEFPYGPTKDGRSWLLNVLSLVSTNENSRVLIAWCGGEFIPEMEKLRDDLLIDGLTYIFNKFLGDTYSNITKPEAILRNNWYENPHFRGTYSYETVESRKEGVSQEVILAQPLTTSDGQTVVLFAGEATHPIYYSTVHGAIESGYREAQRIIDMNK